MYCFSLSPGYVFISWIFLSPPFWINDFLAAGSLGRVLANWCKT